MHNVQASVCSGGAGAEWTLQKRKQCVCEWCAGGAGSVEWCRRAGRIWG